MSILFKSNHCCVIDHSDYILNLYKKIVVSEQETETFALDLKLFSIKSENKSSNRKRKHSSEDAQIELSVKTKFENLLKEIPEEIKTNLHRKYNLLDTPAVRDLSKRYFEATVFDHIGINGGNNSDRPLKCKIKEEYFLIPHKSRFFCGSITEQCEKLNGSKFDIVIADPPWWNKFIRRLKNANDKLSYKMMYNEDIASIPVKNLLAPNGLVAVWCTNSPSSITAVKDLIFPSWGVEYVAMWHWMKVTIDLEPMCAFGMGCKKQPYERLMIGKVGQLEKVPEIMFMSVPSALHSHKPPLLDLLQPYINVENPQVLELFARYLLPDTTSVGYEPLKWQHISLYQNVS
ncbi:N(6)-adenine-specific methyltransferase METTL4 isoform X2 [Pectinophora gossypiella]|uniref:N(6)-adenine-specific methyltransferase METTL4 isoform X2 n=1 Tax=Pectinophora gossypiella TaxID=13191 RepID=UPI00214EDAF3|nr:N(6)-adenine-specific methyltransferase METTL4 isoform X2 [Pectinophora gossypiella]